MARGLNQHTTILDTHPNQTVSQIQNQRLIQTIREIQNAPDAISLSGRGPEATTFDYDRDRRDSEAQLCIGWVVNFNPYDGLYRVQMDGLKTDLVCTDNSGRGLPFAPGTAGKYPADSRVVVYFRGLLEKGIILGSVPDAQDVSRFFSDNNLYAHDTHMWHRIGPRKDRYHAVYAKQFMSDYYGDGRPADTAALGDVSFSNFMGGLIDMSMWQLVLRTSNGCGIWMNFLDDLMRQVSRNFQLWTPAGQVNKYTSGGETFNYEGQALYDWEAIGMLKRPSGLSDWVEVDSFRAADADTETDEENSYRTEVEPIGGADGEKMTPFFRFEQHSGWFGHGGTRDVRSLPIESDTINRMDEAKETAQVLRESVNVSGTFNLQAAGGFSLERTVNIPCFWRKYEQYDSEGDRGTEDFRYGDSTEDKTETLALPEELPEDLATRLEEDSQSESPPDYGKNSYDTDEDDDFFAPDDDISERFNDYAMPGEASELSSSAVPWATAV